MLGMGPVGLVLAAGSRITVPQGLVGRWLAGAGAGVSGTTALDLSRGGNNGALVNGPSVVAGLVGQGLSLVRASSQAANIVTSSGLPTGSQPFTMMCWVKTTMTGSDGIFFQFGNPATAQAAHIWQSSANSNKIDIGFYNDNFAGSVSVNDGAWHHLAFSYPGTGTTVTGYKDAIPFSGSVSQAGNIVAGTNYIGNDSTGAFPTATINDCRIYGRVLSASEIAQIYAAGLSGRA